MALPQRITEFEPVAAPVAAPVAPPVAAPVAAPRIRRCTFRRLSRVSGNPEAVYEASCLFPDRRVPLPLGDLDVSLGICAACTASHIFRPDED
jgi:hypothetical protein